MVPPSLTLNKLRFQYVNSSDASAQPPHSPRCLQLQRTSASPTCWRPADGSMACTRLNSHGQALKRCLEVFFKVMGIPPNHPKLFHFSIESCGFGDASFKEPPLGNASWGKELKCTYGNIRHLSWEYDPNRTKV